MICVNFRAPPRPSPVGLSRRPSRLGDFLLIILLFCEGRIKKAVRGGGRGRGEGVAFSIHETALSLFTNRLFCRRIDCSVSKQTVLFANRIFSVHKQALLFASRLFSLREQAFLCSQTDKRTILSSSHHRARPSVYLRIGCFPVYTLAVLHADGMLGDTAERRHASLPFSLKNKYIGDKRKSNGEASPAFCKAIKLYHLEVSCFCLVSFLFVFCVEFFRVVVRCSYLLCIFF